MAELAALELVQLHMARATAPSDGLAAAASLDLMRVSLVCRTQHAQLCQFRAVSWRLRHEQATVASLEGSLDHAADAIIDLEDDKEELLHKIGRLRRDLGNLRLAGLGGSGVATRFRESVLDVN